MDVTDITAQLSQLDGDIDKMEETMKPLIANLSEIAAKLPLLDKAKLYVLAVYTIETTLFSQYLHIHRLLLISLTPVQMLFAYRV